MLAPCPFPPAEDGRALPWLPPASAAAFAPAVADPEVPTTPPAPPTPPRLLLLLDLEAAAPAAAVPAPPPLRCSSSASAASKGDAAAAAAIVAVAPPPKRDLAEGTCLSAKVRGEGGGRERESDEGEARSEREGVPAAGLVGVVVVIIPEVPVAPAPPPPKSGPNRRPAAPVPPVIAPESTELGKMGAGLLGGVVVKSTSIFLFFFLSMPPLSPSLKRRSLATRRCLDFQKLNPRRCLRDVK